MYRKGRGFASPLPPSQLNSDRQRHEHCTLEIGITRSSLRSAPSPCEALHRDRGAVSRLPSDYFKYSKAMAQCQQKNSWATANRRPVQ